MTTATRYPDIVETRLPALAELCRRFGVRRLDLFGSAVTGKFDPARSDLDFLVEFKEHRPGSYGHACFELHRELEELFGRAVDLLTEPSLKNPYLRRQIESEKQTVYPPP